MIFDIGGKNLRLYKTENDGKNKHIMNIISSIRDNQKIFKNNEEIGTGLGASILFDIKKKNKLSLSKIKPTNKYSLKKTYAFWVSEIKRKNLLKM